MALVIGWLALIAAGSWLLADSQANNRNGMAARLQTRVQFAAGFVSIYANDLISSQRAQALSWFAGPAISQSTLDRDSAALGLRAAVVLDAAWARDPRGDVGARRLSSACSRRGMRTSEARSPGPTHLGSR